MARNALISIICADRKGLVADIAGHLFDLNLDLGDTTFAVLGGVAEFTCIAEVPAGLTLKQIEKDLQHIPDMADGRITVASFDMRAVHDRSGHITHRIEVDGPDRPGVIARLSEMFGQFGANIVRLNSERIPAKGHDRYVTRFAVAIPPRRAAACLAAVANTAGELRMTFRWEETRD
jgi:glycine cleavage system transcriptional repressor